MNSENCISARNGAGTRRVSLQRLVWPALAAALIAGAAATVLQQLFLAPLILQAEMIEAGATAHQATGAVLHAGLERGAYTLLFNCLAAFGYALLLVAGFAWAGAVSWRRGLLWGLAGFAAFSLAPALGLPPELPGAHAADLASRQLWWVATALATAGGLAALALARRPLVKVIGVGLIALPHLVGAPGVIEGDSAVPAEMTRAFVVGSLGQSLVLWLVLGALTAAFATRWSSVLDNQSNASNRPAVR